MKNIKNTRKDKKEAHERYKNIYEEKKDKT